MMQGKKISLRPATEQDKRRIYEWLALSDITPSIMGTPCFPDHPIPTWKDFCKDYKSHFFNGLKPELGRCYIIEIKGLPIGQINHDTINKKRKRTELDIWMNSEENCGKGYGRDALEVLCKYLYNKYGVSEFVVRPSARNIRAIRAYEKAGFKRIEMTLKQQERKYEHRDYDDNIVLIKKI